MSGLIGVDVGGTFTDVVVVDKDGMRSWKVPTTPDQSLAVAEAVKGVAADLFLHGTTAATNTLLEDRGAAVSLLTDPGYEDLIEIGRQDRPSLYDSFVDRPPPLVPRERRHSDVRQLGEAEIVAVSFMNSYADATRERAAARKVAAPTVLSSDISPEFREYERLATTVLSAYLTPSVGEYLSRLDTRLDVPRRLVMTSAGGVIPFSEAGDLAGRLVLSGPAGGAVAAAAVGRHHGFHSVIAFDMGGTSTDVSRITGGAATAGSGHEVAGRVNRVPSIPIRTIGAGGGSVAWIDTGGALRVGPRSSGADPGPAVYGKGGTELTVTDANVLSGHLPASLELGGSVVLDVRAGQEVAQDLGGRLGMSVERVVAGVLEVVDAHMERALRSVTVEEGSDPRESVLVAFGGAGGLHASRLARRLGIERVLVPPHSGVFSAVGLLLATPRADAAKTVMLQDADSRLEPELALISDVARAKYQSMFSRDPEAMAASIDVRYVGQSHELEIPGAPAWQHVKEGFDSAHRERFGFSREESIEVVNVRATARGASPLIWDDLPPLHVSQAPGGHDGVWERSTLPPGFEINGPGVVIETNSATLLEEDDHLVVLDDGTLEISR